MLLEKIDKLHVHRYDFFYLPIDLKNNCNVGYAFINFVDPIFILPFYEDLNVKSWESFNSEKICEITYGRIQGKRSLVDNFSYSAETRKVKPLILEVPEYEQAYIENLRESLCLNEYFNGVAYWISTPLLARRRESHDWNRQDISVSLKRRLGIANTIFEFRQRKTSKTVTVSYNFQYLNYKALVEDFGFNLSQEIIFCFHLLRPTSTYIDLQTLNCRFSHTSMQYLKKMCYRRRLDKRNQPNRWCTVSITLLEWNTK